MTELSCRDSDLNRSPGKIRLGMTRKTCASLVAVDNAPARQVVGRKLHGDLVARQDAYEVLAHLTGDVREHLMLVLEFDAKHGIGERLDHRGHHFDGVLFGIPRFAFLLVRVVPLAHTTPSAYHDGPLISLGRVKIQGPFEVTATVCSKCAEGLPSAVTAVHSSTMRTSGRPAFTMGSTAITKPSC